ncbi:hypothetical protein [Verrucosispora sioxanthis]|nr:hypothetical protein [Verrucosispora sioxanthis]
MSHAETLRAAPAVGPPPPPWHHPAAAPDGLAVASSCGITILTRA